MRGIPKGTPEAWVTRRVVEAWVAQDADALDAALVEMRRVNGQQVTWNLLVVASSAVDLVAQYAGQPFEDVLSDLWLHFAQQETDTKEAQVMRGAVTAWSVGHDAAATALNESGVFAEVDLDVFVMHLVAVPVMLYTQLSERHGQSLEELLPGVWRALGTEGPAT